jgi:D-alanyl-lipoteichoic acid acyltransferase DltB (MBOAT superfamily)
MLFASLDFLIFFLPVLAGYWALAERPRARWILLLASSYFFYCASSKPVTGALPTHWGYVGLLISSTLVDYFCGIWIARTRDSAWRRIALLLSLSTNLGLLGYFKYTGFLLEAAGDIAHLFGATGLTKTFEVALPIGISFYTFQSLSYTIDVYRGRLTPERNLLRFALFVAFFPQLVAGPIVRAAEFLPQLRARFVVDAEDVNFAFFRICKGLVKKVILGDFIAAYFTDIVFSAPQDYSSLENLLALYAFTLQIYADFSGYSDIAIGVARLLGFRLPENFDRPYQSHGVGEFWRRWHMTLSTWLRDYLFFPLGGSLVSEARTYFNLWVTMFLVGMWHGASWNFVIYANLQALAMVYNRYNRLKSQRGRRVVGLEVVLVAAGIGFAGFGLGHWVLGLELGAGFGFGAACGVIALVNSVIPSAKASRAWAFVHVALLFHFTTLSRVFFRADNLQLAREMTQKLVVWDGLGVRDGLFRVQSLYTWLETSGSLFGPLQKSLMSLTNQGILVLLVFGIGYHFTPADWTERLGANAVRRLPAPALGFVMATVALVISQLLSGPRANIYFAF